MKVLLVYSGNASRSPVAEALLQNQTPHADPDSAGANTVVPEGVAASASMHAEKAKAHMWPLGKERGFFC